MFIGYTPFWSLIGILIDGKVSSPISSALKTTDQLLNIVNLITSHGCKYTDLFKELFSLNPQEILAVFGYGNEFIAQSREDAFLIGHTQAKEKFLILDDFIHKISPDNNYLENIIWPLHGLIFPRDHFVCIEDYLIIGFLMRQDRSRETNIIHFLLKQKFTTKNILFSPYCLEGGDILVDPSNKKIIIGVGGRTKIEALNWINDLAISYNYKIIGIQSNLFSSHRFHLDHWAFLANGKLIIDQHLINNCQIIYPHNYSNMNNSLQLLENFFEVISISASWKVFNSVWDPESNVIITEFPEEIKAIMPNNTILSSPPITQYHSHSGGLHCLLNTIY